MRYEHNGTVISFTSARIYISEFTLLHRDGTSVTFEGETITAPAKDANDTDITHTVTDRIVLAKHDAGEHKYMMGEAPEGEYTGVRFKVGIAGTTNRIDIQRTGPGAAIRLLQLPVIIALAVLSHTAQFTQGVKLDVADAKLLTQSAPRAIFEVFARLQVLTHAVVPETCIQIFVLRAPLNEQRPLRVEHEHLRRFVPEASTMHDVSWREPERHAAFVKCLEVFQRLQGPLVIQL